MKSPCPPNLFAAMMRKKPLDADPPHSGGNGGGAGLHRTLTAVDLMLYGVGCSVGAGIYCLVGIGGKLAGPAISLSFLACGTACIFTSLAYAEFAARIPITGSAYVYAYVAFGEYWGWLVGWFLTLGYGFTASVVAQSWGDYVASAASVVFPTADLDYLTKLPIVGEYTCSPLSTVIVALCTWVLVSGAKESSRFNNFMTVLNISVLLFVVLAGTTAVNIDNLTPYAPHGMGGIAQGAGLVFFAFIGFDMVACLSEEVVQPERNMPIGIVGSLVISAAIYVSVSLVVMGMAPIDLLGAEVPITNALLANACCTHEEQLEVDAAKVCLYSACEPVLRQMFHVGSRVVSFGAIFGLTSGTFTSLMGQPRIFYRMAQDGLLFSFFGIVDPKTRVPTVGILITGFSAAMLACFIPLESLANMISLGTLMVFTFVDAGVIILRLSPSRGVGDSNMTLVEDGHDKSHGGFAKSPRTILADEDLLSASHESNDKLHSHEIIDNGFKPIVFTLLFTGSMLVASTTHGWKFILFAGTAVGSGLILSILPQSVAPDTFSCPLVPLVPLIGIAANACMMGSLAMGAWVFVLVWFMLGNAVYFSYGIRHSKMAKHPPPLRLMSLPETTPLMSGQELSPRSYESTLGK